MSAVMPSDDAQRIEPRNARRWYCTGNYSFTIVVATCEHEAKALAAYWFAKVDGRTHRPIDTNRVRARHATSDDVLRWLTLRAQQQGGPRSLQEGRTA